MKVTSDSDSIFWNYHNSADIAINKKKVNAGNHFDSYHRWLILRNFACFLSLSCLSSSIILMSSSSSSFLAILALHYKTKNVLIREKADIINTTERGLTKRQRIVYPRELLCRLSRIMPRSNNAQRPINNVSHYQVQFTNEDVTHLT